MSPYYTKSRIIENTPVQLRSIESAHKITVVMLWPNGYVQTMPYNDFNNRLSTSMALTPDNPVLESIRKELESAIAHPDIVIFE